MLMYSHTTKYEPFGLLRNCQCLDKIHIAYIAISVLAIKLIYIMTYQYLYIHNVHGVPFQSEAAMPGDRERGPE